MKRTLGAVGAVALSFGVVAAQGPASAPADARTIYVTVTDKAGTPVEDLTAADFEIKEGGKAVDIAEAGIAKNPLQIALIVDDNGTGLFRSPLTRFVQRMDGHAVMSLSSVTGQTMRVVDYTQNAEAILQGLATLNARPGTPDGGQLLEGISEAAIELKKREAERPIIIALTVGGEEHSTVNSDHVLDQLRKSGAILHVFSVERLGAAVDGERRQPARPPAGEHAPEPGARRRAEAVRRPAPVDRGLHGLHHGPAEPRGRAHHAVPDPLHAAGWRQEVGEASTSRSSARTPSSAHPQSFRRRQVRSQKSEVKSQKDSDGKRFYFA